MVDREAVQGIGSGLDEMALEQKQMRSPSSHRASSNAALKGLGKEGPKEMV